MRQKQIQHHIDALAALLLFGVFAVCILAVLLTGADAYHRLTVRDRLASDRRTCSQYVATRVRQSDLQDGVAVERVEDTDVLVLGSGEYVTYVYCHDGWLMELYAWTGEPLVLSDGWQLLEMAHMGLSLEEGMLTVDITTSTGDQDRLSLSLRSGEGWDA
ncbi:DUF4860 domain-containing protein [Pseudoflavonifractor sp. 60]|uniref:DUF4860 domain-containing protein n=1 Tax=Pseudoflavonifractor sp. 60 TaxID=2304576 RepID=UPI001370FE1A|nr:DUF4860 domain-containing protein [Pseudoflavonifractor sp. 60]NBI65794.1 DUF4860 domain-containing protein [Pseudoflavonifractor sp. 60]